MITSDELLTSEATHLPVVTFDGVITEADQMVT